MTLDEVFHSAVKPALAILPMAMTSPRSLVMTLAIGLQESGFTARRQMGGGPARGFWQFEKGGGVKGVYSHVDSAAWVREMCTQRRVEWTIDAIYSALEYDDVLAAGCARLLLYTDPRPLPAITDAAAGWVYYERNWNPGKPRPDDWPANFNAAVAYVGAAAMKGVP